MSQKAQRTTNKEAKNLPLGVWTQRKVYDGFRNWMIRQARASSTHQRHLYGATSHYLKLVISSRESKSHQSNVLYEVMTILTSVNVRHMMATATSSCDDMSVCDPSSSPFNERIARPYLYSSSVRVECELCRKSDMDAARQRIADERACPCPPLLIMGRTSTQLPQMRDSVGLFWWMTYSSPSGMKLCMISRTLPCKGLSGMPGIIRGSLGRNSCLSLIALEVTTLFSDFLAGVFDFLAVVSGTNNKSVG